jgi:hypothetical protein
MAKGREIVDVCGVESLTYNFRPMLPQDTKDKLIELFVAIDDFCLALRAWQTSRQLGEEPLEKPGSQLSYSEQMTILVFYHYSGYKCFEYYYRQVVQTELRSYFPRLISYERFVVTITRVLPGLFLFLQYRCRCSQQTGTYFVDSKKLPVCDNRRIHSHRVFADIAARGKTSTGWFFGLKVHLVINQLGEIVSFLLTPGNVADNNHQVLHCLLDHLKGHCIGDKGYLTTLFEHFYERGLQLITRIRTKMKNQLMPLDHKLKLRKRALIESVNDILMSVFDIDHTRHRNPYNAICHTLSGLIAYCFYPNKPSVFIPRMDGCLAA